MSLDHIWTPVALHLLVLFEGLYMIVTVIPMYLVTGNMGSCWVLSPRDNTIHTITSTPGNHCSDGIPARYGLLMANNIARKYSNMSVWNLHSWNTFTIPFVKKVITKI